MITETQDPLPTFGSRPGRSVTFNFENEIQMLPFKLNIGPVHMSKELEARLLNMIYDKGVFSLHDKDLEYSACFQYTITTNKLVYLPH